MDFDGQFARTASLGEAQKPLKQPIHECHCYINDTYEELQRWWGRRHKTSGVPRKMKEA